MILGVSAIIATKDRSHFLSRTINSLSLQSHIPAELIIVDASENSSTKDVCENFSSTEINIFYVRSIEQGAAAQRITGLKLASHPFIWFLDDDIVLEAHCTIRLWEGFSCAENVGAVNAMIINQQYTSPGLVTRSMYWLMNGRKLDSYAGKVIGPAWNLLPEDKPELPEYVACEWLNTTCTMYRKAAMPEPVFPDFFKGYSLMEDLTLSLLIAKNHTLLNARKARIYHDSQPGSHKNDVKDLSCMELVNRYFVMTKILNRAGLKNHIKLTIFELFGIVMALRSWNGIRNLPKIISGKLAAVYRLLLFLSILTAII